MFDKFDKLYGPALTTTVTITNAARALCQEDSHRGQEGDKIR